MREILRIFVLALVAATAHAQTDLGRLGRDLRLELESTTTAGGGDFAPLWLSSNRYGLSGTGNTWNYERVALHRDMKLDENRNWKMGYGVDVAAMFGCERTVGVTEAFFEIGWKKLYITAGSKRQGLMLKNEALTSGGLSYGINARPIPQVRVGVEYFTFPGTKGWWQWKGHVSYGWTTDGRWQKSYASPTAKRTEGTLYHEKCLYWKFGNQRHFPLDLQFGLQWATEFGGTSYNFSGRDIGNTSEGMKMGSGLKAYWNAFMAGGSDVTDGDRPNVEGNHNGSWNVALNFEKNGWKARLYGERFFEDFSQLGLRYGISDHLFGLEMGFPKNAFVSTLVLEHLNTREQSGAVFHDVTKSIPDQMDGRDNYYNHSICTGWQHYGMAMGNPLITSPIYNKEKDLWFQNNRVRAWHAGIMGEPADGLTWRLLMTFTRNWGTYAKPYADPRNQNSFMLEAGYKPETWKGWGGRVAVGLDHGTVLGDNAGAQITILKTFKL